LSGFAVEGIGLDVIQAPEREPRIIINPPLAAY
jgi:hypothetical protein